MITVRGSFSAFVDYVGPAKGKRSKDAVLYTVLPPKGRSLALIEYILIGLDSNEAILWHVTSEAPEEPVFLLTFPKAVGVETIQSS
jgi:hypothetical protein